MSTVTGGVVHTLPKDMKGALLAKRKALQAWESLTPLARNEWICWTISVQKKETREDHIRRLIEDLEKGKRRPCCWPGCPHREKTGR